MASGYHICLIRPQGFVHSSAFAEVCEFVFHALRHLGHEVTIGENQADPQRTNIVFGAHLLEPDTLARVPDGSIIYNLEQIDPASMLKPEHVNRYRHVTVWEYGPQNLPVWKDAGVRAVSVPVGYVPELTRIPALPGQTIDVLFYGSMNERRRTIVDGLRQRGLEVETAFGVYGAQRDLLIARSKAIVNIHYYDAQILETVRLFYLMANRKAVVSERGASTIVPAAYESGIAFAEYGALVDRCQAVVQSAEERHRLESEALAAIESVNGEQIIASAIADTIHLAAA